MFGCSSGEANKHRRSWPHAGSLHEAAGVQRWFDEQQVYAMLQTAGSVWRVPLYLALVNQSKLFTFLLLGKDGYFTGMTRMTTPGRTA